MRLLWIGACASLFSISLGQSPDVVIKLDARLNYRSAPKDANTQRLYDTLGNYSIVSLAFKLEPGFRVFVSQKLQRFYGGNDPELLDEYYIEDEGIWRVGKQYLPFGAGRLLRESVMAARADTNLVFEGLPIAAAYAQGERGRQEGIVGRVGGRLGLSVFVGNHFGIDGTSLTFIRKPEEASGTGRGYKEVYGIDYSRGIGEFNLAVEGMVFQKPNSSQDDPFEVVDFSATFAPSKYQSYTLGWTRRTEPNTDFWRVRGNVYLANHVYLEPMVRYRNGSNFDFSVAVRVRF